MIVASAVVGAIALPIIQKLLGLILGDPTSDA